MKKHQAIPFGSFVFRVRGFLISIWHAINRFFDFLELRGALQILMFLIHMHHGCPFRSPWSEHSPVGVASAAEQTKFYRLYKRFFGPALGSLNV